MWKTIKDFPGYEISITGEIRNKRNGYVKKPSIGKRGYPVVSLQKDGKQYVRTIHILLARTYIPNPENKPEVNHKNGNKEDFSLDNLEWTTSKENSIHAVTTGLLPPTNEKEVIQYSDDMVELARYVSASAASRETGIKRCNICSVARGNTRAKRAGGFIWRYANGSINNSGQN